MVQKIPLGMPVKAVAYVTLDVTMKNAGGELLIILHPSINIFVV